MVHTLVISRKLRGGAGAGIHVAHAGAGNQGPLAHNNNKAGAGWRDGEVRTARERCCHAIGWQLG